MQRVHRTLEQRRYMTTSGIATPSPLRRKWCRERLLASKPRTVSRKTVPGHQVGTAQPAPICPAPHTARLTGGTDKGPHIVRHLMPASGKRKPPSQQATQTTLGWRDPGHCVPSQTPCLRETQRVDWPSYHHLNPEKGGGWGKRLRRTPHAHWRTLSQNARRGANADMK